MTLTAEELVILVRVLADPCGISVHRAAPSDRFYAYHALMFERGAVMAEDELRRVIGEHGFSIANLSYHVSDGGKLFEYSMVIKSRDSRNADALSRHLSKLAEVLEFRIDPLGD